MDGASRVIPWVAVAAAAVWLGVSVVPPRDPPGQMRLQEFARIPVVYRGRTKPFDTLARNALMLISERQTTTDEAGRRGPAVRWLLDVMTGGLRDDAPAEKQRVFRIENDQVLNLLGLKERPGLRYAIEEFVGRIGDLDREANRARALEPGRRDLFDAKVLALAERLELYVGLARMQVPHAVPPQAPGEEWKPFIEAAHEARQGGRDNPAARSLGALLLAYAEGNAERFNAEAAAYGGRLATQMPEAVRAASFEVFVNHLEPFYRCSVLYFVAFLLACGAWLGWTRALGRAAFGLLVVALVVHTFALLARMYLMQRLFVFVTNLYSSAVFIGWGCVVLGIVLECLYRNGIGTTLASTLGFLTVLVSHNLAGDGDTLQMMQAVLDTNFWLATHVTCVTIGYAATFVTGFLGGLFIVRGVLTPSLNPETARTLGRMTYGILCFATFFSFTGTVLGGIWADQSWGRFWGWDPKENGALLIVLWNALILHARWGGMARERGIAVLAVFGNIVTAWSWFGVNLMGVGLHSYGFINSAAYWLTVFVASQLAVMGLGVLPKAWWRSFAARKLSASAGGAVRGAAAAG